jgi:hypothetical protein
MSQLTFVRKLTFIRVAGALGVTALALFFAGLIPLLSAKPSAGAGFTSTPSFTVNRRLKGDRLPLPSEINTAVSRDNFRSRYSLQPAAIPVGCEGAFSPVASPRLAYIFGRCMT